MATLSFRVLPYYAENRIDILSFFSVSYNSPLYAAQTRAGRNAVELTWAYSVLFGVWPRCGVSPGSDQRWLPDALLNGVEQKPEEKRIACALDDEIGRVRVAEERGPARSCSFLID